MSMKSKRQRGPRSFIPLMAVILVILQFLYIFISKLKNPPTSSTKYKRLSSEPNIPVYRFPPSLQSSISFLDQVDVSTLLHGASLVTQATASSTTTTAKNTLAYPINTVHHNALLHFGSWIYLIDANDKILFLKRSPHLVTCPNTWSLVGEHSSTKDLLITPDNNSNNQPPDPDRTMAERMVLRGIREELGSMVSRKVSLMEALTKNPVYFEHDYGGGRVDRQLTYLYYVRLSGPHEDVDFRFDEEVAETRWVRVTEAERWVEERKEGAFCNVKMKHLFDKGIGPLLDLINRR